MTTAWPGTIPTTAVFDDTNYNETAEDNVATTKPLVGPPLRRRRSSVPNKLITFSTIMTYAQWDLLQTFYDTTLFNGVDFFTRPHPRIPSTTVTCTFESRPQSGQGIGNSKFQVQMQIRVYG